MDLTYLQLECDPLLLLCGQDGLQCAHKALTCQAGRVTQSCRVLLWVCNQHFLTALCSATIITVTCRPPMPVAVPLCMLGCCWNCAQRFVAHVTMVWDLKAPDRSMREVLHLVSCWLCPDKLCLLSVWGHAQYSSHKPGTSVEFAVWLSVGAMNARLPITQAV